MNKQKLSIAMISIHSSPLGDLGTRDNGGMSVYIRELARELGRRGHRIDIFTRAAHPGDPEIVLLAPRVRLVHIKVPRAGRAFKEKLYPYLDDFFLGIEGFRQRQRLRYDAVHSHYWLSGCIGGKAGACWDVPHLTTFHTLGLMKNKTGKGLHEPELRIATEKLIARSCSRILVGTAREQYNLARHYHVPKSRIGIVACGVDLKLFRPLDRIAARRSLGFSQQEKILLYVGRFDPLKGISRVLEAVSLLRHISVRFVIVGGDGHDHPEMLRLRALARELSLGGAVRFEGRMEQRRLPLYYSAADLFAMPSLYESFGIVALESLACGTPVIATPVGALDSIIKKNLNGCIVKNPTPAAFARAIKAYVAEGCELPRDAVRESVAGFTWAHAADHMIDEYRAALARYCKARLSH